MSNINVLVMESMSSGKKAAFGAGLGIGALGGAWGVSKAHNFKNKLRQQAKVDLEKEMEERKKYLASKAEKD